MTAKEEYYYKLGKFEVFLENRTYIDTCFFEDFIYDLKEDWIEYIILLRLLVFSEKDKYELMDDYDSFYEKYSDDINNKMKKVIEDFSVDRCIDYNLFDDYFEDWENWDSPLEYKKIHEESYSKLSNEEFVIEMFYYEDKNNEIFNLNRIYYLYVMDKIDIKSEVKELWEFMKKYSHLTADEMYDIYCNGEDVKDCDERFGFNHFIETFVAYLKEMDETELIYSNLNESLMKYYNDDKYKCLFSDFKLIKEYTDKYSDYNHDFMGLMCNLTYDYCNESSKKLLKKI